MKTIHLFDHAEDMHIFPAGTTIFQRNQVADTIYVLVEGEVAIMRDGKEIATITSGSIFGEMAVVEHRLHYATATAKTPCRVVPIDRKRFFFLIEQTPNFALEVIQIMAERLHLMDQRVVP